MSNPGKKDGFFSADKIPICVGEFIGTALLLFLGCMGCITGYEAIPISHYMPSLTFGLAVMIVIQIFGHISGAHFNPGVTLASLILGNIKTTAVPAYLLGEFGGAIVGFGTLKMLVPHDYISSGYFNNETNTTISNFCVTSGHSGLSSIQVLVIEIIITAVLIWICCAVWDSRNSNNSDSTPLRFGFAIGAIAIMAGPFTGASMNTARSFAPALLNGNWKDHWIYWIGPNLGSLIAVYLYKFVFSVQIEQNPDSELQEITPLQNTDEGKM